MKKTILIFAHILLINISGKLISQTTNTVELITPGGLFDVAYDMYGYQYPIANLGPYSNKSVGGGMVTINSLPTTSCSSGYFNIYTDPTYTFLASTQVQTLICQVFNDISNFIYSPLTNTTVNSNNFKINIFVGAIVGNLAGVASSFYLFPPNANNPNQGVIDGLIYKAIKTGQDPYLSIPATFSYQSNNPTAATFYHGYVGLNPFLNWNFDVTTAQAGSQNDGYGVLLHEICHALGFHTLINSDGFSTFGQSNNYFTRYDKFLYDAAGNPLLSNGNQTACPTSSLAFTASLSALYTATTGCNTNITTCSTSAQYSTANTNVKVYTPNCFEPASSLSHFEDMCSTNVFTPTAVGGCTPNPASPGQNDLYFVMSNSSGSGLCYMKRYLKEEERIVLCDLGYSLAGYYGCPVPGALIDGGSSAHYYSYTCTPTETIVGMNDGMVGGAFTYTTTTNTISIPTSSILGNDMPATGLTISCLEIIYNNGFTNISAGVSGSNLTVTATPGSGLALLKYLPKNANGQVGNATYIYVYFSSPNCNSANVCNMVQNSGFETIISPTACGIMTLATGPVISCWTNHEGNPAVISTSCTSGGQYDLGNNTIGSSPTIMSSFNGAGNNRVLALNYGTTFGNNSQVIKNNLSSPLVPNIAYKISFMVANVTSTVSGNNTNNDPVVITIASSPVFPFVSSPPFPTGLNVIANFTIQPGNNWAQVAQNFTFSSPGSNNHSALLIGINSASTALTPSSSVWCYLDEIVLVPQTNPSFNLGAPTVCGNQAIHDLDQFSSIPSIGTYSGTGVSYSGGQYHFNYPSAPLSPGIYPIAYTYTTGSGCSNTIYDIITVSTNTNLFSMHPTNICNSPSTFTLGYLLDDLSHFNGSYFSVNNATTGSIYTFTSTGIFTISAINNSTLLCNNSATTSVSVFTTPSISSFLIDGNSVVSATLCNSYSISFGANSFNGTFFLWQPGNLTSAVPVVSPSVTTIYTLSVYNYTECPATQTAAITVYTNCCASTFTGSPAFSGTTLATTLSGSNRILNDITIPSGNAATLSSGDFLMAQTTKIIVSNNATLTIDASHLRACTYKMWQGIVVQDGGYLITAPTSTSNLIEDAVTAIDISSHTNTVGTILLASNTTFNKNYIDINISNYTRTVTPYPFSISKCVFSCRNLPFTTTNWPQTGISSAATTTAADLRFATSPTTGISPPFLGQNNFTITNLKSPYNSQPSQVAIQLNTVGATNSSNTVFYGVTIGSGASADEFNLFDGHRTFINAYNSNVSSINNVFQNTQLYIVSKMGYGSGEAIKDECYLMNTSLNLSHPSSTLPDLGNRFWNCHRGVIGSNIYNFSMKRAIFRSEQSSIGAHSFLPGNTGVNLTTCRFKYEINNNEFTNINTGVLVPIYTWAYNMGAGQQFGIYANNMEIKNNYFSPQLTTTASISNNEYNNHSIMVSCASYQGWNSQAGTKLIIQNNKVDRVYRGIYLNGMAGYPSSVLDNSIKMVNDNAFNTTQHGIEFVNTNGNATVKNNSVTVLSTTTLASSVYGSFNTGVNLTCNNVDGSYQGFVFEGPNQATTWRGNKMANHTRGMVLKNAGVIGTQGSLGNPVDNEWLGSTWTNTIYSTWTQDGVYNGITFASNSPLFVQSGNPYFPPNDGGDQYINSYGFGSITSTTGSYVCSSGSSYTSTNFVIPLTDDYPSLNHYYMAKINLYRYLYNNDSIKSTNADLIDFYDSQASSSIDIFMQVEENLGQGDFSTARSLNSGVTPATGNDVETNYKVFYNLYLNYADSSFRPTSTTDSIALYNLTQLCHGDNGGVVYQAIALYTNVYLSSPPRNLECENEIEEEGARMANLNNNTNNKIISDNQWMVALFPNPASNQISISSSTKSEIIDMKIIDVSGRLMLKKSVIINKSAAKLELDLVNGIYFVTLTNSANEKQIKKLVIAK